MVCVTPFRGQFGGVCTRVGSTYVWEWLPGIPQIISTRIQFQFYFVSVIRYVNQKELPFNNSEGKHAFLDYKKNKTKQNKTKNENKKQILKMNGFLAFLHMVLTGEKCFVASWRITSRHSLWLELGPVSDRLRTSNFHSWSMKIFSVHLHYAATDFKK